MNAQELEPEVSRLVQAVMKFKVNLSGEETIDDLHILQMDLATLRASVHLADDLLSKEFDKVRGTLLGRQITDQPIVIPPGQNWPWMMRDIMYKEWVRRTNPNEAQREARRRELDIDP